MTDDAFTIGELADLVTGCDERATRKMLNDAGASPPLDENKDDPTEKVPYDLTLKHIGSRVGRELNWLLKDKTKRRLNTIRSLEKYCCPNCQHPIGVGWTRKQGYVGFFDGHDWRNGWGASIPDSRCPGCGEFLDRTTLQLSDEQMRALDRAYSYLLRLAEEPKAAEGGHGLSTFEHRSS